MIRPLSSRTDRNPAAIMRWEAAGALFIISAGSLFHFFYDWFGPSHLLAAVFPVNESVWEHLKLGYWSLLSFSLFEHFWMRWGVSNFWAAKGLGIAVLQLTIVSVFYGYTSVTGHPILTVDITSYVLGAMLCQALSCLVLIKTRPSRAFKALGVWILVLHGLALVLFTFFPPKLPIFMDGRTATYGIPK